MIALLGTLGVTAGVANALSVPGTNRSFVQTTDQSSSNATPSSTLSYAAELRKLNPGARIGGTTQVATGNGQRLVGQKGPDFIVALGPNETIVGGPGADQLGATGSNATIRGGAGDDQLFGGEGSTLVGGPGHDFFYDPKDNGTVRVMSSGNEAVVTGNDDHVYCAPTSSNDVIYANSTDSIDPTCMANHAQVLPASNASVAARLDSYEQSSTGGNQGVSGGFTGRGTNDNPYVSICTPGGAVFCKADQFESRSLKGFWSNEYVPAYKCPPDYPYLYNRKYVPEGWIVPQGVGIAASGMGFNISGRMYKRVGDKDLMVGIKTGPGNSSVTNWEDRLNSYQIKLYCTSDPGQAVSARGGVL